MMQYIGVPHNEVRPTRIPCFGLLQFISSQIGFFRGEPTMINIYRCMFCGETIEVPEEM